MEERNLAGERMSHHFDTLLAKEDPSLNLCDFYLFDGLSGKTVMAMTVNPDVGLSAPDTLHPEGLYAFRFDLNGDAREEVTFKFRFGEPRHRDGSEHTHIQPFVVRKATADDALRGDAGETLVEGETGSVVTDADLRAYVGIAPDLFAANAGFRAFISAFYQEQRYDGDTLLHQQNPFARRNVTAIVLEVPSALIGKGKINAWATISLFGHAPEVQVSRWGLPMVTHMFLSDPESKEQFNASVPSGDLERFAKAIADFAEKMTTYAGSAPNPAEYGKQIAARLCPNTLPYELGTRAAFEVGSFNGRALGDDALDVMLTLAANTPLVDGLAPDRTRIRKDFPYYGAPYTAEEQVGLTPMPRPAKKRRADSLPFAAFAKSRYLSA
jgi:Domain of unknown function (DUF4331)